MAIHRLLILLLFLSACHSYAENYYRLKSNWKRNNLYIQKIDYDRDGYDEICAQQWSQQLDIIDWTFQHYYFSFGVQPSQNRQFQAIPAFDENNFFLLERRQNIDTIQVSIQLKGEYKDSTLGTPHPIATFIRHPQASLENFSAQSVWWLGECTSPSGKPLLIFRLNSSYDKLSGKRGFLALDKNTLEIVWELPLCSASTQYLLTDIDNDDVKEIICSTYATDNGFSAQGISDHFSYLLCINLDGNIRWSRQLDSTFCGCFFQYGNFLNELDNQLFVSTFSIQAKQKRQDYLYLIDPKTGEDLFAPVPTGRLNSLQVQNDNIVAVDINHNGKAEALIGTQDGYVIMYGNNMEELMRSKKFSQEIRIIGAMDLNQDGRNEIIVRFPSADAFVLDENLRIICTWKMDNAKLDYINFLTTPLGTKLLLQCHDVQGYHQELLELEKSLRPFVTENNNSPAKDWLLVSFFCISIFLLLLYSIQRKQHRKNIDKLLSHSSIKNQLAILNRKKQIIKMGSGWLELYAAQSASMHHQSIFSAGKIVPELEQALQQIFKGRTLVHFHFLGDAGKRNFSISKMQTSMPRRYYLLLQDIDKENFNKRVQDWALIAQRLAHRIKNPLTSVKLNAQDLQDMLTEYAKTDPQINEPLQDIIEQTNRIKRMCDGFMRFVEFHEPQLCQIDLNAVVQEKINEWKPPENSIKIYFEPAQDLPSAWVDKQQFEDALQNVFFNAVESLEGKGRVHISTQLGDWLNSDGTESRYILLKIQDNGVGIADRFLDTVLSPYFSTKKEGTGLGLCLVKRIMDAHHGKIDIDSKVGEGTTITLYFRI